MLISTQTASNSASLQWTGLGSNYKYYKLLCTDLTAFTGNNLYLQFGEGATPTWETSNYDSGGLGFYSNGGGSSSFSFGDQQAGTGVRLSNGVSGNASAAMLVDLTIGNLASSLYKNVIGSSNIDYPSSSYYAAEITGAYLGDTTAVTAIRLILDSDTFSGTCSLYGMN